MKDVFGQELALGDTVAVIETGYSRLKVGMIVKFTDKMLGVEVPSWSGRTEVRKAFPYQVAKKAS